MHLFDLLLMTFMYFSIKKFKKDIELRPFKYKNWIIIFLICINIKYINIMEKNDEISKENLIQLKIAFN